jgi:hypothetical protein
MAPTDPTETFANQRHEFILQYYNMAVQDLSRHLGIGWQTLSSVVGTILIIGLAEEKKLPTPLAVSAAIAIAFWGMLNIMDASYWATRAIAFLANVEAVYFYESERQSFHPYVGSHPPLKLLDSLRYQLYGAFVMLVIACAYYAKKISDGSNEFSALAPALKNHSHFMVFYATLPAFVFLFMLDRALTGRHQRIKDYRDFVTNCPGPGLVRDHDVARGMNLDMALDPEQVLSGADLQKSLRDKLIKSERLWRRVMFLGRILCWLGIVSVLVLITFKGRLIP